MARLLADENLPDPVAEELVRLGHDVLTVRAAGHADQSWPDTEVLAFAVREGRAVVTLKRKDFFAYTAKHRDTRALSFVPSTSISPDRRAG